MKRAPIGYLLLVSTVVAMVVPAATSAAPAGGSQAARLSQSTFVGALARGPEGDVWFSAHDYSSPEAEAHRVGFVSSAGKPTEYMVPEVPSGSESLATGSDGNVWFTEKEGIGRIAPGGGVTSFALAPGSGRPEAVSAGPDDDIWFVTDGPGAVGRIAPDGSTTLFPLAAEGASAIAPGPDDDLWFTEPGVGRIGRITAAGEITEYPLAEGTRPNSIVLGPDDNLWFGDGSEPRIGRITPSGAVTFFPVPTIEDTAEVTVGPGGLIFYTAGDEIGALSTTGKISWPACFTEPCEYPPVAMLGGPDLRLQVASGEGHCSGYCGGGSSSSYIFGSSQIGPYTLPEVHLGIGPRLAPVRHSRTRLVIGCGRRAACTGTLRLRALVRPHPGEFSTRLISRTRYSLPAGATREIALRLPLGTYEKIPGNRHFLIVDGIEDGSVVAKRGFDFSTERGGSAKLF